MKHLLLFGGLLLLGSCRKNDAAMPEVVFEGYTGRDYNAKLFGPTDLNDWTQDATWTSIETGLFSKYGKYGPSFSQPQVAASMWQPALWPNPVAVGGQTTFSMSVDKTSTTVPTTAQLAFAVVDTNYTILTQGAVEQVSQQFSIVIYHNDAIYKGGKAYRLYYVVYDKFSSQVYYKGHGDIQF
jgi:hypothetical protein